MKTNQEADHFIPAKDAEGLSKCCADALRVCSDLIGYMTGELEEPKKAALCAVIDGGGRVGIELLVDKAGSSRIALAAIEREGARRVLATVVIGQGNPGLAH